jgi:uncharacterized protein (DUF3084 family)
MYGSELAVGSLFKIRDRNASRLKELEDLDDLLHKAINGFIDCSEEEKSRLESEKNKIEEELASLEEQKKVVLAKQTSVCNSLAKIQKIQSYL